MNSRESTGKKSTGVTREMDSDGGMRVLCVNEQRRRGQGEVIGGGYVAESCPFYGVYKRRLSAYGKGQESTPRRRPGDGLIRDTRCVCVYWVGGCRHHRAKRENDRFSLAIL